MNIKPVIDTRNTDSASDLPKFTNKFGPFEALFDHAITNDKLVLVDLLDGSQILGKPSLIGRYSVMIYERPKLKDGAWSPVVVFKTAIKTARYFE